MRRGVTIYGNDVIRKGKVYTISEKEKENKKKKRIRPSLTSNPHHHWPGGGSVCAPALHSHPCNLGDPALKFTPSH
jgi:hypothetical protein